VAALWLGAGQFETLSFKDDFKRQFMREKIKIVYIINSLALGGAEKLLLDICQNLDKSKYEIYVCTVNGGGPLLKSFQNANVKLKIFEKKSKIGLKVIWQIYKYLKEIKPDIVHTHLFGGDTWGRFAAILAHTPIIISTEHNINLDEGWLKKRIKQILSIYTKKIIAVSAGARDYAIKADKIKPEKITVIYNGIDLSKFKFRGYKSVDKNKKINAVVVARLAKQKGHKYLFSAMPAIIKKYPNFVLNIIGSGNEEQSLKEQAKKLNVSHYIEFWGKKEGLENILPQMDLLLAPSVWEGLGINILEAQSVGLPVLASNTGGIREIITHKKTGLLFLSKNSESIFKAVDLLFSDSELSEQMVKNAYAKVREKFNLEKMVSAYENLYFELINQK
jgi:glycosyltransferase involved in cell wall biosynthesis